MPTSRSLRWVRVIAPALVMAWLGVQSPSSIPPGGIARAATVRAAAVSPTPIGQLSYPRLFLYGGANSSGWPYAGSQATAGTCAGTGAACAYDRDCGGAECVNSLQRPADPAPVNQAVIQAAARYQILSLPPTPLTDINPSILASLRAANPTNNIWAYTVGSTTWCPMDSQGNISYPAGSYYRDYYLAATGGDVSCSSQSDRLLWQQDGQLPDTSWVNVNLAKRVADGRGGYTYPVADDLAQVMFDHAVANHAFDGIFIDVFCDSTLWMETPTVKFDYARAGYGSDNTDPANRTAYDAGWKAGHTELARKLRELVTAAGQPDYPIFGNCGFGPKETYPYLNGWMRENFPRQDGGTWYSNMFRYPTGGLLLGDALFRTPVMNFVFTGTEPYWTPYTAANVRKMRFGLGSASLGDGAGVFEESSVRATAFPNHELWYDEYAVDRLTGWASDASHRGWLGRPKGPAYQMILPNAQPALAVGGDFESGTGDWTLASLGGSIATGQIDATTAQDGAHSYHMNVRTVAVDGAGDPYFSSVQLYSPLIFLNGNTESSVTFWAKADRPRNIQVVIDNPGTNGNGGRVVPITTEWKPYQVVIKPIQYVQDRIRIEVGDALGDVWIDGLTVQAGAANVYRRDFEYGIVLVNPADNAQTVTLERPYTRINGTTDPITNDGSEAIRVTLAGALNNNGIGDALFLLDIDRTPPAAVHNLQAQ